MPYIGIDAIAQLPVIPETWIVAVVEWIGLTKFDGSVVALSPSKVDAASVDGVIKGEFNACGADAAHEGNGESSVSDEESEDTPLPGGGYWIDGESCALVASSDPAVQLDLAAAFIFEGSVEKGAVADGTAEEGSEGEEVAEGTAEAGDEVVVESDEAAAGGAPRGVRLEGVDVAGGEFGVVPVGLFRADVSLSAAGIPECGGDAAIGSEW